MLISPMLHQGGFERICVLTARLLQEKYDVSIVVFSLEDLAYDISGLNVIDLKLGTKPGKLAKIINVIKRSVKLTKLQKKLGIDVSYSFGITANIANSLSFGDKKIITACHSFEEIKGKYYMNLISRRSDLVLCCAKKMADLVQETYHFDNVRALWNPCDLENIAHQSALKADNDITFFTEPAQKVLVSMGREDDVKGFWHLLKIFRNVKEQEPQVKLAIVGSGDFTAYEQMAEELGIKDSVLFTGLKKNPFPYLKASTLYVLTSISEGLPNALVESLAVGLPVVSVNCMSGPAEILHEDWKSAEKEQGIFQADYGILTPTVNPVKDLKAAFKEQNGQKVICLDASEQAMADAIRTLLRDEELYRTYQEKTKVRAEAFSTDRYARDLISCLED